MHLHCTSARTGIAATTPKVGDRTLRQHGHGLLAALMSVMMVMVMVVMLSVKSRAKEESGDISSWRTIVEEKI